MERTMKDTLKDCKHCGEKIIWWGVGWAHNQGKATRDHKAEPK
jgi:hypothetical protein